MRLMVKDEILAVYESLPQTFKSSDVKKAVRELTGKTMDTQTINGQIHKMLEAGLVKRAPPKRGKEARKYIRNYTWLEEWWRASIIKLRKSLKEKKDVTK